MQAHVYWISEIGKARLGTMPRPLGGDWLEDEIRSLKKSGVDVVVSLLETDEMVELELTQEEALCTASEISFLRFPIRDREVPSSREETRKLAQAIFELLKDGRNVAIHCFAGIGRSSLVAACVLMLDGAGADEAIRKISKARGCFVPDTAEQYEWVKLFR